MSGSWAPTDLAVGMHAPPHMVTVAIPAGVGPGQSFQLQTADGGSFQVTVPPGLGPGQSLTVQMPAAPPAGLLPPQASAPAAFAHVAPGGQRESFQPADNARIEAARRSGTLSCRLEDVVLSTGMVLRFEVQFGPPGAPLGKLRSSPTGMAQVNLANGNTRVVEELQVAPGPGPPQPAAAAAAFAHVAPDGTRTPYSDVDNAAIVAAKACGEAKVRVADVALPTGQMLRFEVNFGSGARGSPSGMVQVAAPAHPPHPVSRPSPPNSSGWHRSTWTTATGATSKRSRRGPGRLRRGRGRACRHHTSSTWRRTAPARPTALRTTPRYTWRRCAATRRYVSTTCGCRPARSCSSRCAAAASQLPRAFDISRCEYCDAFGDTGTIPPEKIGVFHSSVLR